MNICEICGKELEYGRHCPIKCSNGGKMTTAQETKRERVREKVRYTILNKDSKSKSYVDNRWCYCKAYKSAHQHPKEEKRDIYEN